MRLVHLSDLHLGFRQYYRLTPTGINQREADVARTFQRAVDRVVELRPNLVVIGGDVFHTVRPTNSAILHAFTQFARLTRELPETIVVMVAGNHDTPRAAETGCILRLFRPLGIHVVDGTPQRLAFPERSLSVLAVPDVPGAQRPALTADPAARHNVLLLHGEVEGMLPAHLADADRAELEIPLEELGAAQWSYVALGHFHVHREIAPNAWYSGSIDYTSANPWGELVEERQASLPGKGIVEHDLETGAHTFHPIAPARPLVDLPRIDAQGLSAPELDAAIAAAVERCPGGVEDKIVRLVVRDVPRHVARELDHRALREVKRRALHFHLDLRRPEPTRRAGQGSPGRRPSLADVVREKLQTRTLTSDLDRERLVELGLGYLREAEQAEQAAAAPSAPLAEA
ncbi:MAG TPA: DNA repair exonuclease [Gemmatimonadaceae bacterium]|nr:DNA repair exonuclease [Gemmatimonadaceae bacterium]